MKIYKDGFYKGDVAKEIVNFMKENDYAMTLLFGNNAIAEEYGCEGIPYLVVIDKEGNIAFKHTGYAPGLDENLVIWSEALL